MYSSLYTALIAVFPLRFSIESVNKGNDVPEEKWEGGGSVTERMGVLKKGVGVWGT